MASEFQIKGLDEALRRMRGIAPKLKKRGVGAALRKAAVIVRKAAAQSAKQFDDQATQSNISKEVVVRTNAKKGRRAGGVAVEIGVRGGAKAYVDNKANRRAGRVGDTYEGGGNSFHWRFLEFGTSKMRAQPFMRPALANNQQAVIEKFAQELGPEIDKAVRKGSR